MAIKNRTLTAQDIDAVLKQMDAYLSNLQAQWDAENPGSLSSWWKIHRGQFNKGVRFIIESLDKTILLVEDLVPAGSDKKAMVMLVAGKLFDYVVVQAFPIWLRPLAPVIKEIVINLVISNAIDFIVSKYNQGIWKKDVNNAQPRAIRKK